MRRIALLLIALQLSGCALFASANAAHSHISGCVDEPAYSVIDALIAVGSGVTLVATNVGLEKPLWFILPGTFALSATLGFIGVAQCRSEKAREQPKQDPDDYPYLLQHPAGVVSDPIDAGVGDPNGEPAAEHELPAAQPGPVLQLAPDYNVGPGADAGVVAPGGVDAGESRDCSIYGCPAHQACVLDEHNRTHCVLN